MTGRRRGVRRMKREWERNERIDRVVLKKLRLEFEVPSKSTNSRAVIDDTQAAGEMYSQKRKKNALIHC